MICSIIESQRKSLPQILRIIAKAVPPIALANRLRGPAKERDLSHLLVKKPAGYFFGLLDFLTDLRTLSKLLF